MCGVGSNLLEEIVKGVEKSDEGRTWFCLCGFRCHEKCGKVHGERFKSNGSVTNKVNG